MVAIAPGFTIGFVRPSSRRSIAATALNGRPVAFDAHLRSRLGEADRVADEREHEWLGDAHDRELDLGVACVNTSPVTPTTQIPKRSLGTRASAG